MQVDHHAHELRFGAANVLDGLAGHRSGEADESRVAGPQRAPISLSCFMPPMPGPAGARIGKAMKDLAYGGSTVTPSGGRMRTSTKLTGRSGVRPSQIFRREIERTARGAESAGRRCFHVRAGTSKQDRALQRIAPILEDRLRSYAGFGHDGPLSGRSGLFRADRRT